MVRRQFCFLGCPSETCLCGYLFMLQRRQNGTEQTFFATSVSKFRKNCVRTCFSESVWLYLAKMTGKEHPEWAGLWS